MNEAIQKAISKFGTQEALAKALGVRQSSISHYLTGRRSPSRRMAGLLQTAMENEIPWHAFIPVHSAEPVRVQPKSETKQLRLLDGSSDSNANTEEKVA